MNGKIQIVSGHLKLNDGGACGGVFGGHFVSRSHFGTGCCSWRNFSRLGVTWFSFVANVRGVKLSECKWWQDGKDIQSSTNEKIGKIAIVNVAILKWKKKNWIEKFLQSDMQVNDQKQREKPCQINQEATDCN